jgi:hypothetical protein
MLAIRLLLLISIVLGPVTAFMQHKCLDRQGVIVSGLLDEMMGKKKDDSWKEKMYQEQQVNIANITHRFIS